MTEQDARIEDAKRNAEAALDRARQSVERTIQSMAHLTGSALKTADAAQDDGARIGQIARDSLMASFDFAQALVRARTPEEVVTLQERFLEDQLGRLNIRGGVRPPI